MEEDEGVEESGQRTQKRERWKKVVIGWIKEQMGVCKTKRE